MLKWIDIKHFKASEFDSPDFPGSGLLNMSIDFVKKLDTIREEIQSPLVITSGFRTYAHNRKVNGASNSAHLKGHAADILVSSSWKRFLIIKTAILIGITRFEDAPEHVHLDDDLALPQKVFVFLPSYAKSI